MKLTASSAPRPSCPRCVLKHLSQACILFQESLQGYPEHRWLAIGHLAEAEAEAQAVASEFAMRLREERKKAENVDDLFVGYVPNCVELIRDFTMKNREARTAFDGGECPNCEKLKGMMRAKVYNGKMALAERHRKAKELSELGLAMVLLRIAMEFDTKDALDKYLKEHPDADKSRHTVKKQEREPGKTEVTTIDKVLKSLPEKVGVNDVPERIKKIRLRRRTVLSKSDLKDRLSKGRFTIISAGRNPNDEQEAKLAADDDVFHRRHEMLRTALEESGMSYTEVVGHYGGKESSFMVFHGDGEIERKKPKSIMVHRDGKGEARKFLDELGKKFNQDSVLHGENGRNEISFTTGKNAGKACGGSGWKETPEAEDYYTEAELKGKEHTKFNLNVDECFEKGFFAFLVERVASRFWTSMVGKSCG